MPLVLPLSGIRHFLIADGIEEREAQMTDFTSGIGRRNFLHAAVIGPEAAFAAPSRRLACGHKA